MEKARTIELVALPGMGMFAAGDDVAGAIVDAAQRADVGLDDGDVLVVAQKIVSKAEDRCVDLAAVTPSDEARRLAVECDKDPRLVELILAESSEVVRHRPGVLVVAHRTGVVLANAGIDASNVGAEDEHVLLLPVDPDLSARRIGEEVRRRTGTRVAVIINDSLGRAWRNGVCGAAIGVWGLPALSDLRGHLDLFGRPLAVTQEAVADELAAAASLLQGQADEGAPVVVVKGFRAPGEASGAAALVRAKDEDLFR